MRFISRVPSALSADSLFLEKKFRHKAAITKGKKIISYGECSQAGCRHICRHLGASCHAEINAIKPIFHQLKVL